MHGAVQRHKDCACAECGCGLGLVDSPILITCPPIDSFHWLSARLCIASVQFFFAHRNNFSYVCSFKLSSGAKMLINFLWSTNNLKPCGPAICLARSAIYRSFAGSVVISPATSHNSLARLDLSTVSYCVCVRPWVFYVTWEQAGQWLRRSIIGYRPYWAYWKSLPGRWS